MKFKLLLVVLIINCIEAFAQIDVNEKIVVDNSFVTRGTSITASTDINGDGYPDIIASGSGLNWYENLDGLGSFGAKNAIASSINAKIIQVDDIEEDGDDDIITLGNNGQIRIYENTNGRGSFDLKQTLESDRFSTVFLSDFDRDGDVDLFASYITSSFPYKTRIVFYENTDGNFVDEQSLITYDDLRNIQVLKTVDIDKDNDLDIVLAILHNDINSILWFENLGDNESFSSENVITTDVDEVSSIITVDIDEDEAIDVITASKKDNKIAWYKNISGEGDFSNQQIISSSIINVQSIFTSDIDNDGDLDLVSAASTPTSSFQASINNKIVWYENTDSRGDFGEEQVISTKAIGAKFVIAKDLNNDGYIDIISASKDDNKIAWYKNTSLQNQFEDARVITRQVKFPNDVYVGDFDGDNDVDILSLSQHDAKVAWYENIDGYGFFGNQRIITERVGTGNSVPTAYPTDIDGDGDLDISVGKGNELSWYENIDGKGDFSAQHIFSNESGHPRIARASDIDKDGDMDLLFGYYRDDRIVWYENIDGNGTFGDQKVITTSGGTNGSLVSMEISDIDGDGDDDIIAVSFDRYKINWYENDGTGTFSSHNFDANETGSIYPADIDGDNDIDIVAVSINGSNNDSVSWYENVDGNGGFSVEHYVSNVRIHGNSINVADMDNDGDLDILTASGHNNTSGKLAWYENINGVGDFSEQQVITEVDKPTIGRNVFTADIDGDDDMDILATFGYFASDRRGRILWYENLGGPVLNTNDVNEVKSNLILYPNPTKNILKVNAKVKLKQIEVFNILGERVKTFYNQNKIDITNLNSGLYFIRLSNENDGEPVTIKVIKE
ncbi:T9SS type A sorting domain-containing protein [Aquimarina rhabdastrellae]